MAAKKIDAKYLDGLTFSYVEEKKLKKDGRDIVKNIPQKRPLAVDDVLDWKDYGDYVVFVTADGRKYKVDKAKGKGAGKADADKNAE